MSFSDPFEEAPFSSNETAVCADCVADDALANVVTDNLESTKCDYCGNESDKPIAAQFDVVMERIYDSICTEYADAQDINLPWVEGGWIVDEIEPGEVVYAFDPGWPDQFNIDVTESLGYDKYWVEHSDGDWGLTNPSGTLAYGWDSFKSQVLTKTRYLFLTEPDDEYESGRPDHIPISKMLDVLGNLASTLNLVTEIPFGSDFYRIRISKNGSAFGNFDDLGLPPYESARAGRMNPAGIPYLYLATDSETAVAEVINIANIDYGQATFTNKRTLKVLNLLNIPSPPSLFEPERYDERHQIIFLNQFQNEISQPVTKDGREHVDYVPTQIVSEYFKYRFKYQDENIDGIMYPSVKRDTGINIAIFASNNDSAKEIFDLAILEMKKA